MSTLSDLVAKHTRLPLAAAEQLQRVVAEWQLLADLSLADFLLWVPLDLEMGNVDPARFLCIAQARPTTAPTAYPEDMVGSMIATEHPQLRRAITELRICREEDPIWRDDVPIRRETIPVLFEQQVIAVLSRETSLAPPRAPGSLEIAYLDAAAHLCQMITEGTFPHREPLPGMHTSPRLVDGMIRLDAAGAVTFASPNALSAYHRMGHAADLVGIQLSPLTKSLIVDPFDAAEVAQCMDAALDGRFSSRIEGETQHGASVLFRALPLQPKGKPVGALVLVRDVTEVRRRDRALLSKDATIREIHHRVKNNLQTVAALLRLQSRRSGQQEVRDALTESVRRVTSIAMVHDILSMSVDEQVDFDNLIDRVIPMMGDLAGTEGRVAVRREGHFGVVPADRATALVLVITELLHNAFEHAYSPAERGEVVLRVDRSTQALDVVISDAGSGLPDGFSLEHAEGLGLQIVRTLVDSELRGSLSLHPRDNGGTEVALWVPLRQTRSTP